jgi:hypothetical protein
LRETFEQARAFTTTSAKNDQRDGARVALAFSQDRGESTVRFGEPPDRSDLQMRGQAGVHYQVPA